jgi:hypothetical protein
MKIRDMWLSSVSYRDMEILGCCGDILNFPGPEETPARMADHVLRENRSTFSGGYTRMVTGDRYDARGQKFHLSVHNRREVIIFPSFSDITRARDSR